MDDRLKLLPYLLLLLFSSHAAYADLLCNESCEFSATFPQGGSLEAIDELTLVFGSGGELTLGTGGTVNTAIQPNSLDFASGGSLQLAAGESITFGPGGSMVLGSGGNMDTLNFNLTSTGNVSIEAVGGSQSIDLSGILDVTGNLTLISDVLRLNSYVTGENQLPLENSVTLSGGGSPPQLQSPNITVEITTLIIPPNLTITSGTAIGDVIFEPTNTANTGSSNFTIQLLTSLDALEGYELPIADGSTCIVKSPECISDDGTIYVLDSESKLVPKAATDESTSGKSGAFDPSLIGLLTLFVFAPTFLREHAYHTKT